MAAPGSAAWWVHFVISVYSLAKGNYDFICVVFGSTNEPNFDWNIMDRPRRLPALPTGGLAHKWCKKCNAHKPMRAHHCSVCNRCVLAMDHHCPLTGNCVGYFNQKYFLLFSFDLTLGALYGLIVTYDAFRTCSRPRNSRRLALTSTCCTWTST